MKIRRMKDSDIESVIRVGKTIPELPADDKNLFWTRNELINWVESKKDVLLVAEKDGKIVGFSLCAHHVPSKSACWMDVWVKEEFRGTGLAHEMAEITFERLKKMGAEYIYGFIKTDNKASKKFVKKLGFKEGFDFTWVHRGI